MLSLPAAVAPWGCTVKAQTASEHHHVPRIVFAPLGTTMPIFAWGHKEKNVPVPATLEWKIESPPAILYGNAESSSGALVSGQLFLDIKDSRLELKSLTGTMRLRIAQKKPFQMHCADCTVQTIELKAWAFLTSPLAMRQGAWFDIRGNGRPGLSS